MRFHDGRRMIGLITGKASPADLCGRGHVRSARSSGGFIVQSDCETHEHFTGFALSRSRQPDLRGRHCGSNLCQRPACSPAVATRRRVLPRCYQHEATRSIERNKTAIRQARDIFVASRSIPFRCAVVGRHPRRNIRANEPGHRCISLRTGFSSQPDSRHAAPNNGS